MTGGMLPEGKRKIWAIGGGKGGVGKTLFTANIGVGLAKMGKKVIVVDSDLGGANLHTMFGIKYVKHNLNDFLNNSCGLDDIVHDTDIKGLKLISGANGILGSANPYYAQKIKIINSLKHLKADYIIVDLGAGTSYNVLDFMNAADEKIVVASSEPTSIQNAYGFLKSAVYRQLNRTFSQNEGVKKLVSDTANPKENKGSETLSELSKKILEFDKASYEIFQNTVGNYKPGIIMNMLDSSGEQNIVQGFTLVAKKFLNLDVDYLGFIQSDSLIPKSVKSMAPFMKTDPDATISNSLNKIIHRLINKEYASN